MHPHKNTHDVINIPLQKEIEFTNMKYAKNLKRRPPYKIISEEQGGLIFCFVIISRFLNLALTFSTRSRVWYLQLLNALKIIKKNSRVTHYFTQKLYLVLMLKIIIIFYTVNTK
jgi:hypothetical protein